MMDDLMSMMLEAEASKGTRGQEFQMLSGPMMEQAEQGYNLPRGLLDLLARTESMYNPRARSSAGAKGLMQFQDESARHIGIDADNPAESIWGSARYLDELKKRFGGDLEQALAAYNWGPAKVRNRGMDNLPVETRGYLEKILGELQRRQTDYGPL